MNTLGALTLVAACGSLIASCISYWAVWIVGRQLRKTTKGKPKGKL